MNNTELETILHSTQLENKRLQQELNETRKKLHEREDEVSRAVRYYETMIEHCSKLLYGIALAEGAKDMLSKYIKVVEEDD